MARQQAQIKIVFLADTHLGFDYPLHPRVKRRHRGHDFFENYKAILNHARLISADLIIHGGDLFFRSRVPEKIVDLAYESLLEVAEIGIPVFIVPGNHERGLLPNSLFLAHPNIFVFSKPKTFTMDIRGIKLALTGFPFNQGDIRNTFRNTLSETKYEQSQADIRLLCIHQAVEGAVVGPSDYTFRNSKDTIRFADIPFEFDGVLSGHIHRHQILSKQNPANGSILPCIYAGSIERTSFAEKNEDKGFIEISCSKSSIDKIEFIKLPARPMYDLNIEEADSIDTIKYLIFNAMGDFDRNAIVRLNCGSNMNENIKRQLNTDFFRNFFPETMNIQLSRNFFRPMDEPGISSMKDTRHFLIMRIKKEVPEKTGVYMFCTGNKKIIYVGKSVNLKQRMLSYFYQNSNQYEYRIHKMIRNIRDFSFIVTETELLALIQEDYLIKRYMPEYNIKQQEIKEYCYLHLTNDRFPTLKIVDHVDIQKCDGHIFGPFKDRFFVNDLLAIIYPNFNLRQCQDSEPFRKSLNYDFGQCMGPCRGKIDEQAYMHITQQVINFLNGDENYLHAKLSVKMQKLSESLEFEKAASIKSNIEFCQNFARRQRFLNRFKTSSLVIHENSNINASYKFYKGELVSAQIDKQNIMPSCNEMNLFQKADDRYVFDRANIVYKWLNSSNSHSFSWS